MGQRRSAGFTSLLCFVFYHDERLSLLGFTTALEPFVPLCCCREEPCFNDT